MTDTDATTFCRWCGGPIHNTGGICPFVAAIEYHQDGMVKRVEFVRMSQAWPPPNFAPTIGHVRRGG